MTDDLDPRWRDALRRHGEAARPTPEAWAQVVGKATDDGVSLADPTSASDRSDAVHRRRVRLGAAAAVVLALVGGGLAIGRRGDDGSGPQRISAGTTTTTTGPATKGPRSADLERCFPTLAAPTAADDQAGSTTTEPDPGPLGSSPWNQIGPVLAVSKAGDLFVVGQYGVVRWSIGEPGQVGGRGYLWAQWEPDGSILASRRVDGTDIRLERFTAPGHAKAVVTLHGHVVRTAPEGFCPLTGYLATFAVGPHGTVVVRQTAGPIPHGCPYMPRPSAGSTTTPADRWRCESPQDESFEVRHGDLTEEGDGTGESGGGTFTAQLAGSAVTSDTFLIRRGNSFEEGHLAQRSACCSGATGTVAALSPDGGSVASSPDGHRLQRNAFRTLIKYIPIRWAAKDRIDALAWAGPFLVVAHGPTLSAVTGGSAHPITVAELPPIRMLDASR